MAQQSRSGDLPLWGHSFAFSVSPSSAATKQPFSLSDPCFEKGTTIQYNEAAAKKVHEDLKVFVKEAFAQT